MRNSGFNDFNFMLNGSNGFYNGLQGPSEQISREINSGNNRNDSDITIRVFNHDFIMDKESIVKIPFLKDTLLPPEYQYRESETRSNDIKLYNGNINDISYISNNYYTLNIKKPEITMTSFRLMLKRVYGTPDVQNEKKISVDMLHTGVYFGFYETAGIAMKNLIVNKELTASKIQSVLTELFQDTGENESIFYDIISEETSVYFLANGWEKGPKSWDSLPLFWVFEYVKNQQFYVPTEFDRALFIIRLIKRRLKTIEKLENIDNFKKVLNENIIYCNISVNKLIELGEYQDPFNISFIDPLIIQKAIKMSFEMAESISNTTNPFILKDCIIKRFESGGNYFDYSGYSAIVKKYPIIENLENLKIPPIRLSFRLFHIDPLSEIIIPSDPFFYAGSFWSVGILPLKRHGKLQIVCFLNRMNEFNNKNENKKQKFNIIKGTEINLDFEKNTEDYNKVLSPSNNIFDDEEEGSIKSNELYNLCPKLCFRDLRKVVKVYMVVHILYESQNEIEPEWMTALMDMKLDTPQVVPAYRKDLFNSKYSKFLKFNIALGLL